MQKITCANYDLRTAVQRDNLLRKVGRTNFFASLSPNDIVRSEESLSLFNQSLKQKIQKTHEQYQGRGTKHYTLSIASYPASVKDNSCSRQKTIDFNSKADSTEPLDFVEEGDRADKSPLAHYIPVPGKEPRTFHVREYNGQFVICEQSEENRQNRLLSYCGSEKKGGAYKKCKKSLTPSCAELDREGAKMSGPSVCVSMQEFASLSQDLLMSNTALEWKYCPDDCSYYTQTVQAFYKNKKRKYCSDSYLIVHCGPKRKKAKYNLNIREINDLCRDFESCTYI